ncbi:MAG: hypothetical protein K2K84_07670 [Muribaculaceae bacterium]|nr:hypothetical protein [Muribaculaceae bacterium]
MEVFDEEKAVRFILESLGERAKKYDEDDILDVIDIIWDYYEDHGFLDISMDPDDTEDIPETDILVTHVIKMIKRDRGSKIDIDDIKDIVVAELEYEAKCDEI